MNASVEGEKIFWWNLTQFMIENNAVNFILTGYGERSLLAERCHSVNDGDVQRLHGRDAALSALSDGQIRSRYSVLRQRRVKIV